jgi:hypothetical protein
VEINAAYSGFLDGVNGRFQRNNFFAKIFLLLKPNTFVLVKDDLNRLAKDIDAVEALWEGNLVFQTSEDEESIVPLITTPSEDTKSINQTQTKEAHSIASINQNTVQQTIIKELISLLMIVQLPIGQTVPEEQRVFLRKMIQATNIPGSKMKYFECYSQIEIDEIWTKYSVDYWMFFGSDTLHQISKDGKMGIMVPPIEKIWDNIPIKKDLWSLMKSYFGIS